MAVVMGEGATDGAVGGGAGAALRAGQRLRVGAVLGVYIGVRMRMVWRPGGGAGGWLQTQWKGGCRGSAPGVAVAFWASSDERSAMVLRIRSTTYCSS